MSIYGYYISLRPDLHVQIRTQTKIHSYAQEILSFKNLIDEKEELRKKTKTSRISSNFLGFFIYKVSVFHYWDSFFQEVLSKIGFKNFIY